MQELIEFRIAFERKCENVENEMAGTARALDLTYDATKKRGTVVAGDAASCDHHGGDGTQAGR